VIEFAEAPARVDVDPAEYNRLLGYPPDRLPKDRADELAQWAREWYAANGRPWVYARLTARLVLAEGTVAIEGVPFAGSRLRARLGDAEANAAVLVAVSAGPELEAEAGRLWREERPDEYFFLEMFGAAVVEHLLTSVGARLCDWAEARQMAVLPHDSPGYPGWDVAEQPALLALLASRERTLPGPLDVLASGALVPKKSQLAVFGVTRHVGRLPHLATLVPCCTCGLAGCQYRRSPYRRAAMCQHLRDPDGLLAAIAGERPLDDVLSWQAATSAAGCYCDPASRDHGWSLVLQTIHYALARRETAARPGATSR
jgi:hypothetical protein